jgi:hypothetical protein
MLPSVLLLIKILILSSVLFVWVVRYDNIVEEFKQFGYPQWLRDFVGILKITSVGLLLTEDPNLVSLGSLVICTLMLAALATHLKVSNPFYKMLPSFSLFSLSLFVFIANRMSV